MAQILDLSDLIRLATGDGYPESIFFYRDARVGAAVAVATVAGRLTSLWQYNGIPAGGAKPGAAAVPNNATAGGLLQTNPGGTREKWLLGITAASLAAGTLILYDRLLHCGGLDGTVTTPQAVGGTLTRSTGGIGNQIWAEIYDLVGVTARNITAIYTNENDEAKTTVATAIGGTGFREAQRLIVLPLAAGDRGVKGVTSVTLDASTGTAGDFGVNVINPVAIVPLGLVGVGSMRDFIAGLPSIVKVDSGACLAMAWLANATAAPQVLGSVHFVEK